ncbi:MAG: DNA-binding protein [Clostridia bacterium]|nr:DNA-binding protein [Clostridia bacterium]
MFEKNMNISFLLDFYGDVLTEKQQAILDLYYNEDLSLAEIAESNDLTRQGVRHIIKKAEDTLMDLESKLGLASRFIKLDSAYNTLANNLKDICNMVESGSEKQKIIDRLNAEIESIKALELIGE